MDSKYYYFRDGKIHCKTYDTDGKLISDYCYNVATTSIEMIKDDLTKANSYKEKQYILGLWYKYHISPLNERIDFVDFMDKKHFEMRQLKRASKSND